MTTYEELRQVVSGCIKLTLISSSQIL